MNTVILWKDVAVPLAVSLASSVTLLIIAYCTIKSTARTHLASLAAERQRRSDQEAFELRKDLLLAAAVGAHQAVRCIPDSTHGNIQEVSQRFQAAVKDLVAALPVASVETVRKGRAFLDDVGPTLLELIFERVGQAEERPNVEFMIRGMNEVMRLDAPLRELVAAIRRDISIDRSDQDTMDFLDAAIPNKVKFDAAIEKIRNSIPA